MKAARLSRSNHREGLRCGIWRSGDDHNDQDYDEEDGDNDDLLDNEAGLLCYPHRLN